jgi:hypothetical protein
MGDVIKLPRSPRHKLYNVGAAVYGNFLARNAQEAADMFRDALPKMPQGLVVDADNLVMGVVPTDEGKA